MRGGTSTSLRRDGARRAGRAARARSNELAAAPKELYSVPDAGHVDLYDKTGLIPFDKLEEFCTKNLA
ncbi:hypothetical protein ABZ464_24315 [Streptomyces sp. NPDC005820]|uniref:hypothetical protein n=1 Tax=Streptomyces sp. NPDC005820 TaxID=3157069 RepID=UPI00341021A4